MSARLVGVALAVAVVLVVWTVFAPAAAVDGRGVLALVIAVVVVACPPRRILR